MYLLKYPYNNTSKGRDVLRLGPNALVATNCEYETGRGNRRNQKDKNSSLVRRLLWLVFGRDRMAAGSVG